MHSANWDNLRFVLSVAEHGSVSGAAKALGINHATVLRRVAAFEEAHGGPVFEKTATGYRVLPDHTRLLQGSKRRFIRKFQEIEEKYHSGEWSEAACQRHILPLLAFIRHADTKTFRENVILGHKVQLS